LKISITKIGLVEWLKVKVLSLSPHTSKKKKRKEKCLLILLIAVYCLELITAVS
jgi:hypothetical protein